MDLASTSNLVDPAYDAVVLVTDAVDKLVGPYDVLQAPVKAYLEVRILAHF